MSCSCDGSKGSPKFLIISHLVAHLSMSTRGIQSDIRDLWHHWWEGPSDPNVGEGPWRLERPSPTKTRSHEGKAISFK
jgi:hypothetical protein